MQSHVIIVWHQVFACLFSFPQLIPWNRISVPSVFEATRERELFPPTLANEEWLIFQFTFQPFSYPLLEPLNSKIYIQKEGVCKSRVFMITRTHITYTRITYSHFTSVRLVSLFSCTAGFFRRPKNSCERKEHFSLTPSTSKKELHVCMCTESHTLRSLIPCPCDASLHSDVVCITLHGIHNGMISNYSLEEREAHVWTKESTCSTTVKDRGFWVKEEGRRKHGGKETWIALVKICSFNYSHPLHLFFSFYPLLTIHWFTERESHLFRGTYCCLHTFDSFLILFWSAATNITFDMSDSYDHDSLQSRMQLTMKDANVLPLCVLDPWSWISYSAPNLCTLPSQTSKMSWIVLRFANETRVRLKREWIDKTITA